MNKIILIFLFVSCMTDQREKVPPKNTDRFECTYRYFLNSENKLDSTIIDCPDIKPPKG